MEKITEDRMQIIVMSDTHGERDRALELFQRYPNVDLFIHCGDIGYDHNELPVCCYVAGNHDHNQGIQRKQILIEQGYRILVVHGDAFEEAAFASLEIRDNMGYEEWMEAMNQSLIKCLLDAAKQDQCDLVLYGHTHLSSCVCQEGIWLVNPGSLAYGLHGKTYAYIQMDEQIKVEIRKLEG